MKTEEHAKQKSLSWNIQNLFNCGGTYIYPKSNVWVWNTGLNGGRNVSFIGENIEENVSKFKSFIKVLKIYLMYIDWQNAIYIRLKNHHGSVHKFQTLIFQKVYMPVR